MATPPASSNNPHVEWNNGTLEYGQRGWVLFPEGIGNPIGYTVHATRTMVPLSTTVPCPQISFSVNPYAQKYLFTRYGLRGSLLHYDTGRPATTAEYHKIQFINSNDFGDV